MQACLFLVYFESVYVCVCARVFRCVINVCSCLHARSPEQVSVCPCSWRRADEIPVGTEKGRGSTGKGNHRGKDNLMAAPRVFDQIVQRSALCVRQVILQGHIHLTDELGTQHVSAVPPPNVFIKK